MLASRSSDLLWGVRERKQLKLDFKALLDESLGMSIKDVNIMQLPDPVARWVLENKSVLASIP